MNPCVPSGLRRGRLRRPEPPEQRRVLRLLLQPLDRGGSHEGGRQLPGRGQLRRQALRDRRRPRRRHLLRQGGQQMCASPPSKPSFKHIVMTAESSDTIFSNYTLKTQGMCTGPFYSKQTRSGLSERSLHM